MQYAINISRNAQTKRLNEYHNKLQIFETVFNCEQLGVLVVSGKKKNSKMATLLAQRLQRIKACF